MRPMTQFLLKSSFVCLCVIAAGQPLTAGQFYKWVDKDGNTVYSRNPPPGDTQSKVVTTPGHVDNADAMKAMQAEIKRANSQLAADQKKAKEEQKAKDDLALQQENCRRARTRVASYSVPRGRIIQPDGTQTRPDEQTRLKMLAEAKQSVEKWCKGQTE